jgi:hypothetical protein
MATYTYVGMTEKAKKAYVENVTAKMKPQDKRGEEPRYTINSNDSEDRKEAKRKATAAWKKAREAEVKDEVDKIDACLTVRGIKFEKAKGVVVDEDDKALVAKLDAMVKSGVFLVKADKEAAKPAAKSEEKNEPKK